MVVSRKSAATQTPQSVKGGESVAPKSASKTSADASGVKDGFSRTSTSKKVELEPKPNASSPRVKGGENQVFDTKPARVLPKLPSRVSGGESSRPAPAKPKPAKTDETAKTPTRVSGGEGSRPAPAKPKAPTTEPTPRTPTRVSGGE